MTMKYADVVLPASSFAEKDGTFTNTERRINRVRAAVPCPGDARVDRDIVIDLARALGASCPDYPDAESVWNEMADLAPAWYGIRYDRLEEQGMQWPAPGSATPARRISTRHGRLVRADEEVLPREYQPPIEQPDSEYPFILNTGRTLYHYNSATMTMREPGITDKQRTVLRDIGRGRANLGLGEGDLARIVATWLAQRASRSWTGFTLDSSGWRSTSRGPR